MRAKIPQMDESRVPPTPEKAELKRDHSAMMAMSENAANADTTGNHNDYRVQYMHDLMQQAERLRQQ